ncbi:MAG: signal peptidase II [Bdellovibrionales bacterium]|nr:signal peptidase II [Bdellovibrionales bacterium]
MDKKTWMWVVFIPLFVSWGVDRVSKYFASGLVGDVWNGPLGFILHHNPGAILGIFSELPALLRVVSLATAGAFLMVAFFVIQYLLPSRSLFLRIGMSLLMGGILGNVTDRVLHGYVIDFLVLGAGAVMSPAFNIADVTQWVGYLMIVSALLRDGKNLWPVTNTRRSYWINTEYQLSYCLKLVGVGVGFSLITGTYCFTYVKIMLADLTANNKAVEERFLAPFLIILALISISFLVLLFLVGVVLSHRSAGPIYAFEKFLEDLFEGKPRALRLRAGADFKHLEELAERISKKEVVFRDPPEGNDG